MIAQSIEEEAFNVVENRFRHLNPDRKSMDEIWLHYNEKLIQWKENRPLFEKFLKDWNKTVGPKDQISNKLMPAEKIIESLFSSGNPTVPEDLTPPISPEQMEFAFLNARFMRNRFTIADIMGVAGMMNDTFWQRVDAEVRRILTG